MPKPLNDLTNKQFGKLNVLRRLDDKIIGKNNHIYRQWLCRCECGKETIVLGGNLTRNKRATRSCVNCCRIKHKHKLKNKASKTYTIWRSMKDRCSNSNNKGYKYYGGRGITYDPTWENFENFLKDMGECPKNMSIERKDVNGIYCKSNCIWADTKTQNRNKRNTVYLNYKNETLSLGEWSEKLNIHTSTIHSRLRRGWDTYRTLSTAIRKKRS